MKRLLFACAIALPLVTIAAAPAFADVKTREKSQAKFEGMLGRIFNLFGGGKPIVQTVAVQGDRMVTRTDKNGQMVDLGEEKIYEIDFNKKTYRVTTFEEMRRRMREAREQAEKDAKESKDAKEEGASEPGKEMEVDFDVKETGQKKQIAGHDAREVLMTVTVREKGKTLDEAGGIVVTLNNWLGPQIPAMKEETDFNIRYWKQLQAGEPGAISPEQMATMFAMFPGVQQAMERLKKEEVNLEGAQLASTMKIESVKSKAAMSEQQSSGGGGGLGGMLARRMKKSEPKQRSLLLTVNHEVEEISTAVAPADLAIPPDFKEKK